MSTTPQYINQRINNLQAQLNALQPYPPPEIQTLSDVLANGNSAGTHSINMNGSAYPPAVPTINQVLGAGSTAVDKTQTFISTSGNDILTLNPSLAKVALSDDYAQVAYNEVKVLNDALDSKGTLSSTELFVGENGGDLTASLHKNTLVFTDVSNGESSSLSSSSLTFITPSSDATISTTNGYNLIVSGGGNLNLNAVVAVNAVADSMDITTNNGFTVNAGNSSSLSIGGYLNLIASDLITLQSNNDAVNLTAQTDLVATSVAGNINLITNTSGTAVNMVANNINMNNATITPSFSVALNGNITYTFGSQNFDSVIISVFTFPTEFIGAGSYTSTRWKLNWDMSLYNSTTFNDKAFAMYIDFEDDNGNIATPFLYDNKIPYCNWTQPALFVGGIAPQYKPVNWGDMVDFNQSVGIGTGNQRLRVWYAGDNPMTCDFKLLLTLTKTNGI